MKIVFLAPFGLRPKGTLLARMLPLAKELQALGDQVVIIAPPYTNPEDSGMTETVDGVRVVNIHLSCLGKTLGAPLLAWRMVRAALAEQPDLVHLFKPKGYAGLAAMWLCLIRRLGLKSSPLFVDTDDWEGDGGMNDLHAYSLPERWLYAFQEQWLPRQACGVTVASRALEERVRDFGVPVNRLLYLPNSVTDVPAGCGERVRNAYGLAPDAPVVLLYTRFFEFPQTQLHQVFAGISKAVPEVRFLVVGKGRFGEDEQLQAAAKEYGFVPNLIQAGWVQPEHVGDYLAATDLAIYPFADTLLNRCKCPAKLTEILRAGVPVVADAVGQINEYLRPNEGGLLCTPGQVDEMVAGVLDLISSPAKRKLMGQAGRAYLLEHFSWRAAADDLLDFYRRADE